MKHLILAGALALGITGSAFAYAANSDLIIGFRDTSGTITTSFEVDLGSVSSFGSYWWDWTEIVNLNQIAGTTLSSWGGSSNTLNVGIVGTSGNLSTQRVLWGSRISDASAFNRGAYADPYSSGSSAAQAAGGASALAGLYLGATFAPNTGYTVENSYTRSYASVFTRRTGGLTAFSPKSALEGTFGSSNPLVFDLYQLNPTDTYPAFGTQFVGTFALYSDGSLWFTNGVESGNLPNIPEPSTHAVLVGAVALGVVLWRRQFRDAVS